ncbi:uncharacterized protein LOC119075330 isoform X2 [Bradysia coprophila]|uniref:uncharacterized protein LOC119075330 isoform X2 n=1 Tax=Bradysia coprophila TaxID=38358 RepID=UPI00187D741F|nr:uncharacterized protein LOC119075330 isoform X2 [Bradysia coprophila]
MWTKSNFEVIVFCFLSLIPWPGPSVFKISCSRESARVVRKIVQSKWLPILDKYQVKLPVECPFHPIRDIFGPQQVAKKQNRPSQWTCGFCGKSFYEEKHLDRHFERRHTSSINMAEDAVCLSDYCDIMRCDVLVSKDSTFGDSTMTTDIEIWREATSYRTALQPTGPKDLAKLPARNNFIPSVLPFKTNKVDTPTEDDCDNKANGVKKKKSKATVEEEEEDDDEKSDEDGEETDSNTTSTCENLVDSSLPPVDRKQQRIAELQKMKANCKSEDLEQLKTRCEILVRNCIVGLLAQLSDEDFKNMEDELNRAVCWYLTCERYWEDGPIEQRAFPWGLVFVLVMVLSLGVCFCYYIIWILFDSDDHLNFQTVGPNPSHLSPTHHRLNTMPGSANYHLPQPQHQQHIHPHIVPGVQQVPSTSGGQPGQGAYGDEFYVAPDFNDVGQSEHYIYVTYPPELKRRLLESCYNRTTRL